MNNTITTQSEPQVEPQQEPKVDEPQQEPQQEPKVDEPNAIKHKLLQFYTKNKIVVILSGVFLVSLLLYLFVHSFAHTEDQDTEQPTEPSVKTNTKVVGQEAYLNLLSAKFSKFKVATLHWNNVSGDTWRWDSWDRARQAEALIGYLRAYDNLYIKHTELDAGSEARTLWVYALTMERISIARKCSYSVALNIIATKPVTEVVSILNTKSLSSEYVAELKKL
jgi:hypothetical protein